MAEPLGNGAYLLLGHTLDRGGVIEAPALDGCTERHMVKLDRPAMEPVADPVTRVADQGLAGLVMELEAGWPGLFHMRLMRRALDRGLRVLVHWPAEGAVEVVDRIRLKSFRTHWWMAKLFQMHHKYKRATGTAGAVPGWLLGAMCRFARSPLQSLRNLHRGWLVLRGVILADDESVPPILRNVADDLDRAIHGRRSLPANLAAPPDLDSFRPAGLERFADLSTPDSPLHGAGLYLRTDFWAPLTSGGSYGHTCHVARELARRCSGFLCLMACPYPLLDAMGLRQVTVPPPGEHGNEETIVKADSHYEPFFRAVFQALAPAFVYERICLGNGLGARLCRDMGIPYVVEYNGSEISMKRSFSGEAYEFEDAYLAAEAAAFAQADAINVVSKWVKRDVVQRGVDPAKVLVNPNGVDVEAYAPASPDERRALRDRFGWNDGHMVIGFIGTFGGWHGVDVLAQALPRIAASCPEARFLIIGDGNTMPLVRRAVDDNGLQDVTALPGRVPQEEGAQLLKACDILVSPHSSNMVDSPFFGSPTKLFEYMALGAGIVASDLEQIGEVLTPGLRVDTLRDKEVAVTDQRAVLVTPGDVNEFAEAVVLLAERPEIRAALGANARKAAKDIYSWDRHVDRLMRFLAGESAADLAAEAGVSDYVGEEAVCDVPATDQGRLETGDAYKDQAQAQWDQDPCGSHYVRQARLRSLEWFREAEAYRYGQYAPWMPEVMEFDAHAGHKVLEVGGGMGTDLSRFARAGAVVTDYDLSRGHLALARENFAKRGLDGEFLHGDAEHMPFGDDTFDVVYSNGVIHHIPDTQRVIDEMFRVLRPGGKAIVMVYAEHSKHYWKNLVYDEGVRKGLLLRRSMGDIMSEVVELSRSGQRPLVKVYTARRLREMFARFENVEVLKRQMIAVEKPGWAFWMSLEQAGRLMGWNLIVKAVKPGGAA